MGTTFCIVAAISVEGGIGYGGQLPWKAPADLVHFKKLTVGHPVLMGRKTYESLPAALKDRRMLILTRNGKTPLPKGGALVFSVESVVLEAPNDTVFVIGGSEIYRKLLPYVSTMHLTVVHVTCAADTYFPYFDPLDWKCVSCIFREADESNPALSFLTLERIQSATPTEAVLPPHWADCWVGSRTDTGS